MAALAEQGVKGRPLEQVGEAHHKTPGFLSGFADTEIEFSQLSQSQRLTLTKTRMKVH